MCIVALRWFKREGNGEGGRGGGGRKHEAGKAPHGNPHYSSIPTKTSPNQSPPHTTRLHSQVFPSIPQPVRHSHLPAARGVKAAHVPLTTPPLPRKPPTNRSPPHSTVLYSQVISSIPEAVRHSHLPAARGVKAVHVPRAHGRSAHGNSHVALPPPALPRMQHPLRPPRGGAHGQAKRAALPAYAGAAAAPVNGDSGGRGGGVVCGGGGGAGERGEGEERGNGMKRARGDMRKLVPNGGRQL
ncbi:unnamed protein product [Closterium sp. NIES-53]